MKSKPIIKLLCLFALLSVFSCSSNESKDTTEQANDTSGSVSKTTARPVHWTYEGEEGPEHWAKLSPAYALCGEGKNQSPINIEKLDVSTGANWRLNYKNTSLRIAHNEHMNEIIDNGHTIQATVDPGSSFTFENKTYNLKQFHFHTPSEHTIDGQHLPMEMHLVHQSEDGTLAVIAVLFKEGEKPNQNLAQLIAHLPNAKGESVHLENDSINVKLQVPPDSHAYHYIGSLTTPPCSENVQWLVLRQMIIVTPDQVKAFSSRVGANNRPTQPLNGRHVKLDELKTRVK
jgi:carbonic anhydrase